VPDFVEGYTPAQIAHHVMDSLPQMTSGLQHAMDQHPVLTQGTMRGISLITGQTALNNGDIGKTLKDYK